MDDNLFCSWSLREFTPLGEEFPDASCFEEPAAYFLFADHSINCFAYAIRLSWTERPAHRSWRSTRTEGTTALCRSMPLRSRPSWRNTSSTAWCNYLALRRLTSRYSGSGRPRRSSLDWGVLTTGRSATISSQTA